MKIIVTGSSKGIGKACAEEFAKMGWELAICSRSEEDLKLQQRQLLNIGAKNVLFQAVDLSKKEQVNKFGQFVLDNWSELDILLNNAGIYIGGKVTEEEDESLEKMIDTNLYSAYYLTKQLLPVILKTKGSYIFNMCSIASLFAYPNGGSYSISKFALHGYTKCLREELKDQGVRVSAILPGATWSNSWAGVELPYERIMPPEDIAKTVSYAYHLSHSTVVEDIVLRPQLGDL